MLPTELRYFEEVASSGSIREAAEKLHIAGSAVSRQIGKLEETLGASLFKRTSYGMKLTQAGRILLAYVRQSRLEIQRTQAKIRDIVGVRSGDLIVFVPEELTNALVSRAIATFRANYSNVEVIVRSAGTEATMQSLINDTSDIGLALNPTRRPEIEFVASIDHSLCLISAPSLPLGDLDDPATFARLPAAMVDESLELHQVTVSALEEAKRELSIVLTANSIALIKDFVCSGQGVALLPELTVLPEAEAGKLTVHRLPWLAARRDVVQVCVRKDRSHSVAGDAFLAVLLQEIATPAS